MRDPNKSKVLCVVAKGYKYTLRAAAVALVAFMAMLIAFVFYDNWNARVFFKSLGVTCLFLVGLATVIGIYIWAEAYAKDC